MKVLALEPYHGGSHKAFLDGWSVRSRHDWTILGLPAYTWKWRMRHGAITLADEVRERIEPGHAWDVLFCSDMLNLAEFLGLSSADLRMLPSVAYFHENQFTYPARHETEHDYHFAFTNITTALAATQVWFNSAFHRDAFLGAMSAFLARMPDHQSLDTVDRIRDKSRVYSPGVVDFPPRGPREPGPLRILWAARWEHDKNPETFFEAIGILKSRGIAFRLGVIGEQFTETPFVFDNAKEQFRTHIDRWGYQKTRREYEAALIEADVIVSTADHEFFGISIVEAIAAGAYPLLPNRLAYPEVLASEEPAETSEFFYQGKAEELSRRLTELAQRIRQDDLWNGDPTRAIRAVSRFNWSQRAPRLDAAIEELQAVTLY